MHSRQSCAKVLLGVRTQGARADARGVASAVAMAASLAKRPFQDEVASTVKTVMNRRQRIAETSPDDNAIKAAAV